MSDDDEYDPTSRSATLEIAPGVFVRGDALRIQFSRSGGPGGQNVNKINSKAELWIKVGAMVGLKESARTRLRSLAGNRLTLQDEIHLRSETERSQEANRQEVLDRLRQLVIAARTEPKLRRKTKPSRASKQRRLQGKLQRKQIKQSRRGGFEE